MKAKHQNVVKDMEHKISRAIIEVAVNHKANAIAMGDIRDIGDGVELGKRTNQKISGWNHGKVRAYVEYKAEAEGIVVKLVDEKYTSQTCPNCANRHKPRGRTYRCPSCSFQSHRDVVGQINILSTFKFGEPGKIPAPTITKHRMPHNLRLMRRRRDTGQALMPVARGIPSREATGFQTQ
jgi:putative transposase